MSMNHDQNMETLRLGAPERLGVERLRQIDLLAERTEKAAQAMGVAVEATTVTEEAKFDPRIHYEEQVNALRPEQPTMPIPSHEGQVADLAEERAKQAAYDAYEAEGK